MVRAAGLTELPQIGALYYFRLVCMHAILQNHVWNCNDVCDCVEYLATR